MSSALGLKPSRGECWSHGGTRSPQSTSSSAGSWSLWMNSQLTMSRWTFWGGLLMTGCGVRFGRLFKCCTYWVSFMVMCGTSFFGTMRDNLPRVMLVDFDWSGSIGEVPYKVQNNTHIMVPPNNTPGPRAVSFKTITADRYRNLMTETATVRKRPITENFNDFVVMMSFTKKCPILVLCLQSARNIDIYVVQR